MRTWEQTIAKIESHRHLTDDWDSEGTAAPSAKVVDAALALARKLRDEGETPPLMVPVSCNSTIYFEWHDPYREIEVTG